MIDEKIFEFQIDGEVKAKQSVKFARCGNYIKKYTPKDMTTYANWVKLCFQKAYPNHSPIELEGYYLNISIFVHFKIPKSFSKKQKELAKNRFLYPDKKPDWDNISKNICDALNGIAYMDDKAIVKGRVEKIYSEKAYVSVVLGAFKYV